MTSHVVLLWNLIALLLHRGSSLVDPTYFIPGQITILQTIPSETYLKDFRTVIKTVNHTLTLTRTSDEGTYSPIVGTSSHSHIVPDQTLQFTAASLCPYKLSDVLQEVPPSEFQPNSTAVVPCAVVGYPRPTVWWQVKMDGQFSNLTLTERVFMSPNNHLILKNAKNSDSGTYRCVGRNECGFRCPTDDTCLTEKITLGDPITITVSPDTTISPNRAYDLHNKLDPYTEFVADTNSCLLGDRDTQCLYRRKFAKRKFGGNSDVVFVGDANFSKVDWDDPEGNFDKNEFGICMFECLKNSSSQTLVRDILPLNCSNVELEPMTTNCMNINMSESRSRYSAIVINNLKFIPDIKLSRLEETVVLSTNNTQVQFYTSKSVTDHADMKNWTCYQNNREIVPDFRTSITKIVDRRNDRILFSVNKECLMRADIGDYFCKITDMAGYISLSLHTSVLGVQKFPCMGVILNSKTTTSLEVSWEPTWVPSDQTADLKYLVAEPLPCHSGDGRCGEEISNVPLTSAQSITNITDLTPGCCYGITVFLATGSVLAENRNVSEYKTAEVPPETQTTSAMQYNSSYYQNDKLRIWWKVPDRSTWGSDTLTYKVTRRGETQTITGRSYLVVEEILREGQALKYGEMRVCNAVGCSQSHDIVVTVPYRPNKPRVQLLNSGCRELKLNMSNEDSVTYKKYRYGVLKYTEYNDTIPELLFTGNLSMGLNTVRYLKEGKMYNLKIWGVNSENSITPLLTVAFETKFFCAREITIVSILACTLLLIGIMVIVVVRRRIRKKDAMYTYTMSPSGDNVFSDLEDDISIIHINHDQATVVKPSRNFLLRLKLSLGLKRLQK